MNGPVGKVRTELHQVPEVAVTTADTFDLMIEVTCTDKAALAELAGEQLRRIDGVQSSRTFQYLELVKFPCTWAGLQDTSFGS